MSRGIVKKKSSRIALISSSDRVLPGYESGNWSNFDHFKQDWEFILNETQWKQQWSGHPTNNLNQLAKKFQPHKVELGLAWRVVTERLNRAYAVKHRYDYYYARCHIVRSVYPPNK
jgi:hypothetical protein